MTDAELDEIRQRCEAVTPGPWSVHETPHGYSIRWPHCVRATVARVWGIEDSAFVANAREDVPRLLAEIDRLRACREVLAAIIPGILVPGAVIRQAVIAHAYDVLEATA